LLRKEFILEDLKCRDAEDALRQLGTLLHKGGVVKDTFIDAVIKRERIFPTGLPAAAFDVAIPHTDSLHVKSSAIAVGIVKNPVEFIQMGSADIVLKPEIIIMLAIDNAHEQLSFLRKIMSLLQNESLLKEVQAAGSKEVIYELLTNNL